MNKRINQKSPTVKQKVKEYFSKSADIGSLLNSRKDSSKKLLHKIVTLKKHYECLHAKQETLANLLNISRKTINIAAQDLEECGLIRIERRGYLKSHIYHLTELVQDNMGAIRSFFKNFFLFSMILLTSKVRSGADVTLLYYKDLYLFNVQVQQRSVDQSFYFSSWQWPYKIEYEHDPNPRRTIEEFESLFHVPEKNRLTKKGEPMIFDEAQLAEIAQHSKELYNYALRMVTKDIASGKQITNQAKYFMSILRRQAEKTKTPETGMGRAQRPPTGPQSQWKKPVPTHTETLQETYEKYKEAMPQNNIFAKIAFAGIERRAKGDEKEIQEKAGNFPNVPNSMEKVPDAFRQLIVNLKPPVMDKMSTTESRSDNKKFMSKVISNVDNSSTLDHISEPLDILNEDLFEEIY